LLSERRTKIRETHTMPGRMMSQTMSEEDIGWDCNVLFDVPNSQNGRPEHPAQWGGLDGNKNSDHRRSVFSMTPLMELLGSYLDG
jgi:hypothetical protein